MDDTQLIERIDALANEEHKLFEMESSGDFSVAHQERLKELQVMLDRCWDLMRQRRAKREFGLEPDATALRDEKTVETYVG
jgi:hypothetical protein